MLTNPIELNTYLHRLRLKSAHLKIEIPFNRNYIQTVFSQENRIIVVMKKIIRDILF